MKPAQLTDPLMTCGRAETSSESSMSFLIWLFHFFFFNIIIHIERLLRNLCSSPRLQNKLPEAFRSWHATRRRSCQCGNRSSVRFVCLFSSGWMRSLCVFFFGVFMLCCQHVLLPEEETEEQDAPPPPPPARLLLSASETRRGRLFCSCCTLHDTAHSSPPTHNLESEARRLHTCSESS